MSEPKPVDPESAHYLLSVRLTTLMHGLNHSTAFFHADKEKKYTRFAVQMALNAILDFLQSVQAPGRGELPRALLELIAALREVDEGREHPIFKPEQVSHRPRARMRDQFIKGFAAGVMELYMQAGSSKDAAAAAAAQAASRAGVRLSGRDRRVPRAGTIAAWRDHVIGHADDGVMAFAYRSLLEVIDRLRERDQGQTSTEHIATEALKAFEGFTRDWNLEKPPG